MALPFFYTTELSKDTTTLALDDATCKHIVQVLRMQAGDPIQLTNGKGFAAVAEIVTASKKSCTVTILSGAFQAIKAKRKIGIAISPLKNASRFEWFLEKASELGVSDIYPLICHRTEREHFRYDRMNAICISAMLQSQQAWLPVLHQPIQLGKLVDQTMDSGSYHHKWIAHCTEQEKHDLTQTITPDMKDGLIFIGPEGDFTNEEIQLALNSNFKAVALGDTRLRTETAGIAAAVIMTLC